MDETDQARSPTSAPIHHLDSAANDDGWRERRPRMVGANGSWCVPTLHASGAGIETPMAMAGTPRRVDRLRWQWRIAAFAAGILLGAGAMWTALAPAVPRAAVAMLHR